jgi:hypothetical protein
MLFPMGVRAPKPVTTTRLYHKFFLFCYQKTNKTHAFTVLLLQNEVAQ